MSDWRPVKLRDISELITKGTTPTTLGYCFESAGVNFIKSESLTDGGNIDTGKFAFISKETHNALRRSQIKENDILMSMAGIYLGKVGVALAHHLPANTNQAVAIIRLKKDLADPRFVSFYLRNPSFNLYINNLVAQSAQPNINLNEIGNLTIDLPTLAEQKRIAHILGTLDDKIEINRRMNETLEGIAQAIFKSWFVDFDPVIDNAIKARKPIPDALAERAARRRNLLSHVKKNSTVSGAAARNSGNTTGAYEAAAGITAGLPPDLAALFPSEFQDSELGPIPKGWDITTIGALTDINAWTLGKNDEIDRIEYIEISEVSQGNIGNIQNYERGKEPSRARRRLRHGDTVLSTVRPDRRSYFLCLTPSPNLIASTGFAVFSPTKAPWSFIHAALTQKELFEYLGQHADGGAYPAVHPEIIGGWELPWPTHNGVNDAYHRICAPMLEHANLNRNSSRNLAYLRETFLPKLLCGFGRWRGNIIVSS